MGDELVGAGNGAVGECGDAGEEKQVPRLRLGITKTKGVALTRKQRGEMAEAAFLAKAASLGFLVSKPWGESSRYDLIVDNGRRLLRVQVKSADRAGEYGGYTFHAHGNTTRVYRASEIDLLAAYVVPVDVWYLFPVEEFRKYKSMKLFPASRRRRSKFEKFREAWGIVR
ncbi:MAG: group I intron-associated PD-(D/E)XK endonuclease [Candidatus Sulfotelmatobacter sp.]